MYLTIAYLDLSQGGFSNDKDNGHKKTLLCVSISRFFKIAGDVQKGQRIGANGFEVMRKKYERSPLNFRSS